MVTQARKPQSKVHPVVAKPHPVAEPVPEVVDIETVLPEAALGNVEPPVKPSEDELVLLQEVAEEAPEEVPEDSPSPVSDTYEVRFTAAHTFGNRVYLEGETAFVPKNDPFYGLSPEEQEATRGKIRFVPVTD